MNENDAGNPYTVQQRKSLHLWCGMVAEVLNNSGLDQRVVLKESVQIPWDKLAVKKQIYKPILEVFSEKFSTEDQSTTEPSYIVDFITRHFGEKFKIVLPTWPDKYRQSLKDL